MTFLALVRHGETDWNAERRLQGSSDVPLNAVGRTQAANAGASLATHSWDVLVSSPLSRAGETADIIGTHLGLQRSVTHPGLSERHFGAAEGSTDEERWDLWPDGRYPGLEPHSALTRRGLAALDDLASGHPRSAIVAVSHGGLIRAVIGAVSGLWAPRIPNAGIVTLHHDGDRWSVRTVNGVGVARRAPVEP
ncbi:histidine phosphatase family protein [Rhodococcus sp. NPDC003318]|uniref:histidine phosphatase family protein n=1 Tax=Rhodococcus sp. NPDC003318 TaxID=3364503 RepID=UPI0036B03369